MSPEEARALISTSLLKVVPDAELDTIDDDEDLREALELDSLDFLSFAEMLSQGSGRRIDEVDYPQLVTTANCVSFLAGR